MAHVIIKDLKDYQLEPNLSVDSFEGVEATLFGKQVFFRGDKWLRNVHIKINDFCNAQCSFCIEKDSHIPQVRYKLLENLTRLLNEMKAQDLLFSVTITGGEPTLCNHLNDVLRILKDYNIFLTMNTNGHGEYNLDHAPDWINISKHDIDDSDVFGLIGISSARIKEIKRETGSKIRLQAVLLDNHLNSVDKILDYINHYRNVADDFGFRQLIKAEGDYNGTSLLDFRKWLYKHADFIEQVIQDYYVYETWSINGKECTLSLSDMGLLTEAEITEPAGYLREVIVHPDGLVSGDWGRVNKILSI